MALSRESQAPRESRFAGSARGQRVGAAFRGQRDGAAFLLVKKLMTAGLLVAVSGSTNHFEGHLWKGALWPVNAGLLWRARRFAQRKVSSVDGAVALPEAEVLGESPRSLESSTTCSSPGTAEQKLVPKPDGLEDGRRARFRKSRPAQVTLPMMTLGVAWLAHALALMRGEGDCVGCVIVREQFGIPIVSAADFLRAGEALLVGNQLRDRNGVGMRLCDRAGYNTGRLSCGVSRGLDDIFPDELKGCQLTDREAELLANAKWEAELLANAEWEAAARRHAQLH